MTQVGNAPHGESWLLVDTDDFFRESARQFLLRRGYSVFTAAALARDTSLPSDLRHIVVDVCPAGRMDLDPVGYLRSEFPQAVILAVTAYPALSIAVDAVALGADDCLAKPLSPEELISAVHRRIDGAVPQLQLPSLGRVEWEYIQRVLEFVSGNITAAARVLGIERSTLQRKLRKYPPRQ